MKLRAIFTTTAKNTRNHHLRPSTSCVTPELTREARRTSASRSTHCTSEFAMVFRTGWSTGVCIHEMTRTRNPWRRTAYCRNSTGNCTVQTTRNCRCEQQATVFRMSGHLGSVVARPPAYQPDQELAPRFDLDDWNVRPLSINWDSGTSTVARRERLEICHPRSS